MAVRTEQKNLLRTKTFWGGLSSILAGVGLIVAGEIPVGINLIATGLVGIFLRDSVRKIKTTPIVIGPAGKDPS